MTQGLVLLCLHRLADLVGFEVAVATGTQYLQSFPGRCYRSMLIPIMLEDKRTGTNDFDCDRFSTRFCQFAPSGLMEFLFPIHLLCCSPKFQHLYTFVTFMTGESSCKGFYVYDEKRKASPDPDIKKYIEKSRNISGVTQVPKVSLLSVKADSCSYFRTKFYMTTSTLSEDSVKTFWVSLLNFIFL